MLYMWGNLFLYVLLRLTLGIAVMLDGLVMLLTFASVKPVLTPLWGGFMYKAGATIDRGLEE